MQRVSAHCLSKQIFTAHRPGDSRAKKHHEFSAWRFQLVSGWHTETHTNLGGHFNLFLQCLGDRAAHSTEREGVRQGARRSGLVDTTPRKQAIWNALDWEFCSKHSWTQDGPAQSGEGQPPLLRQSATTKAVHTAARQSLQQLSNSSVGRLWLDYSAWGRASPKKGSSMTKTYK